MEPAADACAVVGTTTSAPMPSAIVAPTSAYVRFVLDMCLSLDPLIIIPGTPLDDFRHTRLPAG
jgi:hypothetical protein